MYLMRTHPSPYIQLRTFGRLQLIIGGQETRLPTKCAVLLTAVSLESEKCASRDWLIDLLWHTDRAARSVQSLNQAVYTLRRMLGKSAIELTQSEVVLNVSIWADSAALVVALRQSDLQKACSLYHDAFLKTIPILSDTFEDWRTTVDAGFRYQIQQALRQAWQRANFEERTKLLEGATRLLPDDEAIRRFRISALLARGDHEAARAEFERLSIKEDGELGVSAVLSWDDVVKASQATRDQRHVVPSHFVGRDFELSTLSLLWRECQTDGGRLALIAGEAGMGKTTLCQAFVSALPATTRVIGVTAYESARHVGYNVLADLVSAVNPQAALQLPHTLAATLADFVPNIQVPARGRSELPEQAAERRLHEAATQLIISLSTVAPIILVLDDLQWCDSIDRLEFFAHR
jgi:DNA-binding SARP family transcriptional activator